MTWNYRVVRRSTGDTGQPITEPFFGIYEAYYEEESGEKVRLITRDAVAPIGESVAELQKALLDMMAAIDQPVIEWEDVVTAEDNKKRLDR